MKRQLRLCGEKINRKEKRKKETDRQTGTDNRVRSVQASAVIDLSHKSNKGGRQRKRRAQTEERGVTSDSSSAGR